MKKIILILKCEWEIFCFVESCESITNTKDYTIEKINSIYKKYGLQNRAYAFKN